MFIVRFEGTQPFHCVFDQNLFIELDVNKAILI